MTEARQPASLNRVARFARTSLWLVPIACVVACTVLALVTNAIDTHAGYDLVSTDVTGDAGAVQTILSSVATVSATLAGLVLTVVTVAVQLAMGQFSPRIVGALLRDRASQFTIGLFGGTFVYCLVTLRHVATGPSGGTVPGVSTLVAYALTVLSVVALYGFVHHAGQRLRASGLIDLVGEHTRAQFDRCYPSPGVEMRRHDVLTATKAGTVVAVDERRLVAAARRGGCVLELVPAMGDFVPSSAPLVLVHGECAHVDARRVLRSVVLAGERTHTDDPAYGLRKLVDIAERSIAQPFDDPTTTVQAIDRLHDALRQLANRQLPSGRAYDADGTLRLVWRAIGWEGYVRLVFDEIRLAGACSPQVTRRLVAALDDLECVVPAERREPLQRQRRLLEAAVRRAYDDEEDIRAALVPDAQGIGSGPDVVNGERRVVGPAGG